MSFQSNYFLNPQDFLSGSIDPLIDLMDSSTCNKRSRNKVKNPIVNSKRVGLIPYAQNSSSATIPKLIIKKTRSQSAVRASDFKGNLQDVTAPLPSMITSLSHNCVHDYFVDAQENVSSIRYSVNPSEAVTTPQLLDSIKYPVEMVPKTLKEAVSSHCARISQTVKLPSYAIEQINTMAPSETPVLYDPSITNDSLLLSNLKEFLSVSVIEPLDTTVSFRSIPGNDIQASCNSIGLKRRSFMSLSNGALAVTTTSRKDIIILQNLNLFCGIEVTITTVTNPICEYVKVHAQTISAASEMSQEPLLGQSELLPSHQLHVSSSMVCLPVNCQEQVLLPAHGSGHIPASGSDIVTPMDSAESRKRKNDKPIESIQPSPKVSVLPPQESVHLPTASCIHTDVDMQNVTPDSLVPPPPKQFAIILHPLDSKSHFKAMNNGKILSELARLVGSPDSIIRMRHLSKGSILVEIADQAAVSKLMALSSLLGIPLDTSLPKSDRTCKGVIRNLHPSISSEYIVAEISKGGTHAVDARKMLDAHKSPTLAVVTFTGTSLPNLVHIDKMEHSVRLYYETPLQCHLCHRLGHHQAVCRSKPRCMHCSAEGHQHLSCPVKARNSYPKCCNCAGQHPANAQICPARQLSFEILKYRAKHKITFAQAKNVIHPSGYSYAAALERLQLSRRSSHQEQSLPQVQRSMPPLLPNPPNTQRFNSNRSYAHVLAPPQTSYPLPPQAPTYNIGNQNADLLSVLISALINFQESQQTLGNSHINKNFPNSNTRSGKFTANYATKS